MYTQFEEFAMSSLSGGCTTPPRLNGKLNFDSDWSQIAFAIAIDLSKQGYFEWEDFRQGMIATIAEWEATHLLDDSSWSYYDCWTRVLEQLIVKSGVLGMDEIHTRFAQVLDCKAAASAGPTLTDHS